MMTELHSPITPAAVDIPERWEDVPCALRSITTVFHNQRSHYRKSLMFCVNIKQFAAHVGYKNIMNQFTSL